jgi:signal transduction histidine kinase
MNAAYALFESTPNYDVSKTTIEERCMVEELVAQLYEQIRRQANELQEKNAELERSNEVKLAFLRSVSHEVRTPLTISIGYSRLLLDGLLGSLSQEQTKAVGAILNHSTELLASFDNVLEATRLETASVMAEPHDVNFIKLLEDLRAGYGPLLHDNVILEWRLPSELPTVRTDVAKVKRILRNLLSNAMKFTEQGSVVVSVGYLEAAQAIELKVEDTGIGIPQPLKSMIFDLFYQGNNSATRVHDGMGLGLYIVKKYTELLRYKVEVESEVGRGSTFTITLPLKTRDNIFARATSDVAGHG